MKNGAGPTVLVRTDMDALPVEEETGLPYASKVVDEKRRRQGCPCHARLRTRHSYGRFIGDGARSREAKRSMARHDHVRRHNQRRRLGNGARALLKDGLYDRFGKPNFALGFHDKADLANRPHRCHRRLYLRKCRFSRCHRPRRRRTRRVSAQDERSDRARRRNHQRLANHRQPGK